MSKWTERLALLGMIVGVALIGSWAIADIPALFHEATLIIGVVIFAFSAAALL